MLEQPNEEAKTKFRRRSGQPDGAKSLGGVVWQPILACARLQF